MRAGARRHAGRQLGTGAPVRVHRRHPLECGDLGPKHEEVGRALDQVNDLGVSRRSSAVERSAWECARRARSGAPTRATNRLAARTKAAGGTSTPTTVTLMTDEVTARTTGRSPRR